MSLYHINRFFAVAILVLLGSQFVPLEASDSTCAGQWDALFTRTEGWLGADGIYSIDLSYDAETGKSDSSSDQRLFWFSDTFFGETHENGDEYGKRGLVNHSFAILTGKSPLSNKIEFFYSKDANKDKHKGENIIPGKYWLQDGMRYGDHVWLSAILVGRAWKPDRIDAVSINLDPSTGRPDFNTATVDPDARLSLKRADAQLAWGAAILDDADDGYIYVYGYVDRFREFSRKDMVVARVPRARFEDYGEWRYYDNGAWTPDATPSFSKENTLVRNVSTEFSVSRIPSGKERGKYLLVYTPGVISPALAYRIGETPIGPFGEEQIFYRSSVPQELPSVKCYNGKAHPTFSNAEGILVSYNVNRLGELARKPSEYRPRFVWLRWAELVGESSEH